MKVKIMSMLLANHPQVADCEYVAAFRNESYKKCHRSGKRKLMKAYLYTNELIYHKEESLKDMVMSTTQQTQRLHDWYPNIKIKSNTKDSETR